MSTYEKDIAIIEAATPGPWQLDGKRGLDVLVSCLQSTIYVNGNEMDADFIAHFNPVKVRELVEENQRLLKTFEHYKDECKELTQIIALLTEENQQLRRLLGSASCPECNGSGAYYDFSGSVCQCCWCHEKEDLLK